jgi:AcrR family transcriptional regulator
LAAKTRTKFDVKREASRAALLDAAMRSFAERGYAATTVADIAGPAGHTSGAFYFHFKDKAECFWAVVERREELRGAWWEEALEGLDPQSASLEEVLARAFAHFEASLEGVSGWVLVMVDFHQQHRGDGEVGDRLAAVYRRWHAELAQFVSALAAGGWIEAGRDPDALATQAFAFAEGMFVHQRLYGLDPEAAQEAITEGLVRLLG